MLMMRKAIKQILKVRLMELAATCLADRVRTIVDEDEHRLIQFLLSGTVIDTRINGTSTSKPYTSKLGSLQGDSFSLVLYTVYLDHAFKDKIT